MATREVRLTLTLLPATLNDVWEASPLTGRIVQIVRHWPRGCNALVDIAVGRSDRQVWLLPNLTDIYVALDNSTPVVTMSEPVSKGERLWMKVRNGDGVNPHTVTATFILEGVQ